MRLTEVEAYDGPNDPGSHAYRGRTAPQRGDVRAAGAPLRLLHLRHALLLQRRRAAPEGAPRAVLLRAGEVVDGLELARERRAASTDRDLARGPARLCQALGIDLRPQRRRPDAGPLTLTSADAARPTSRTGPRVGLRQAADRPWRFWVDGDPTVSTYRPAVTRRRA